MDGPIDTSQDVAHLQIELWRRMSPQEKLRLVSGLTLACRDMCMAGIRLRSPGASEDEVRRQLARITLGPDLAAKLHPDARPGRGHTS